MVSLYEASNLLATIRAHHGDAQISETDVRMFLAELMPSLTVDEARRAIVEYYSVVRDRWCGAGDINSIVRAHRDQVRPSEAQIEREAEKAGLTAAQTWLYRRQRMLGVSPVEAHRKAISSPNPLTLPPAKPKPKREGPGFAGVTLTQVVGGRNEV